MCGIAGFTCLTNIIANKSTLQEMGQAIIHRGPDASDIYLDDCIGLCHRRLSIIDISSAGIQPMQSQCGNYIIVFNGEIYNFQQLRKELIETGNKFISLTDTEVILTLYQRYGEKLLDKINGMFAFAIWDKKKKSLFIARDRLGKKPLYYCLFEQELIFASELKALLKIKLLPKQIRIDAVYDFFAYQYIPDPKTIYENIFKLEPGHYLLFQQQQLQKHKYWDVSFAKQTTATKTQITQQLDKSIKQAIRQRMVADVPLGAFLSGGVDSSVIVALMAKQSEQPVTTCTIGFNDDKFDESSYANIVAQQYQTDHHVFKVKEDLALSFEHITSFFDEPFADPSLIPTYYVSKLARKKVTVALAGDGGDEMFAGYKKYALDALEHRIRKKTPKFVRLALCSGLSKLCRIVNHKSFQKAATLFESLSLQPDQAFYLTNAQITDKQWQWLISDDFKDKLKDYHPSKIITDYYAQSGGADHLSKILYTDIKTYLPGDILVKVDRMSMANSLEVRAPLLDYNIAEYAATISSQLKLSKNGGKSILKATFKHLFSDDFLYRKKMGFSPPLNNWLRNELKTIAQQKLLNSTGGISDYFKRDKIETLWQQHQSQKYDHSNLLWSMLMFQMWWDHYMVQQ